MLKKKRTWRNGALRYGPEGARKDKVSPEKKEDLS